MLKSKVKLSVALATINEEANIADCLESVENIADEVIVVDGSSTDKTAAIAKKFGAKVVVRENPPIFHINKQKALNLCRGKWILQLDADERVTPALAKEIKKIVNLSLSYFLVEGNVTLPPADWIFSIALSEALLTVILIFLLI